jgi:hypothetical protein
MGDKGKGGMERSEHQRTRQPDNRRRWARQEKRGCVMHHVKYVIACIIAPLSPCLSPSVMCMSLSRARSRANRRLDSRDTHTHTRIHPHHHPAMPQDTNPAMCWTCNVNQPPSPTRSPNTQSSFRSDLRLQGTCACRGSPVAPFAGVNRSRPALDPRVRFIGPHSVSDTR